MKLMNRNKRIMYYCPYESTEEIKTSEGWSTGEYKVKYGDVVELKCSISVDKGKAQQEMFGIAADYDKAIITDDMDCKMDEYSVLFVDKEPEYDSDGNPIGDYRVTKRAESLNMILFAISKVNG